jgi:hypothetical protein
MILKLKTEMTDFCEERVFHAQNFFGETFDFGSQIVFSRFDACVFVDCNILIDTDTEQLAFTDCTFKDCNIDRLVPDQARALIFRDNIFERPIAERKADFERRLAEALARVKAAVH